MLSTLPNGFLLKEISNDVWQGFQLLESELEACWTPSEKRVACQGSPLRTFMDSSEVLLDGVMTQVVASSIPSVTTKVSCLRMTDGDQLGC